MSSYVGKIAFAVVLKKREFPVPWNTVYGNSDADLSSLRIDRSSRGEQSPRQSKRSRKSVLVWTIVLVVLLAASLLLKNWFSSGVEVQLATASLTSPSQANAVLTASGYVVARRKAAVASKGTGTLVFLGVEEGDKSRKGQVIARLDDSDVAATLRACAGKSYASPKRISTMPRKIWSACANCSAGARSRRPKYDVAEARYKRVLATIEAAKFAVQEAEVAVENTRIIAPFDGTVLEEKCRRRRNRRAAGRRGELEGGGGHHRRYVIAGSRRRRFRGEHHARQRRSRIVKSPWMPIRSSAIPATSAISCPPRTAPRRR